MRENVLTQLAGAGEAFVASGADMPFAAVATRAALGRGAAAARLTRTARPTFGLLGRQRGHSASELDCSKGVLDAAARSSASDVLQLGWQLRGRRCYELLLRGGRAWAARFLRELGAALRTCSRVRWRTGHLAHIFDALALYPR